MPIPTPAEAFDYWKDIRIENARMKPTGEVLESDGVLVTYGDVQWSLFNMACFTRPAVDEAEVSSRLEVARSYFRRRGCRWSFVVWNEWLTQPVSVVLERSGLVPRFRTILMASELCASPRPSPDDVVCRRVTGEAGRMALMELNAACYGIPMEWALELARTALFRDSDIICVGYLDEKPVSAVCASLVRGWLYIGWLATLPEYRKLGYGLAVARTCYREARRVHGIDRTIVLATEAGLPMYRVVGYQDVTGLTIFTER